MDVIIEQIKHMSDPTDPKCTSTSIVIGGVTQFTSLDEAAVWLGGILWDAYAPTPIATYVENDDQTYSGIFCARFASPTDRIKALSSLKTKIAELGDNKTLG